MIYVYYSQTFPGSNLFIDNKEKIVYCKLVIVETKANLWLSYVKRRKKIKGNAWIIAQYESDMYYQPAIHWI